MSEAPGWSSERYEDRIEELEAKLAAAENLLAELTVHDFRKHGCWTAGMHGRVRDVIGQAKYEKAKTAGGEM